MERAPSFAQTSTNKGFVVGANESALPPFSSNYKWEWKWSFQNQFLDQKGRVGSINCEAKKNITAEFVYVAGGLMLGW